MKCKACGYELSEGDVFCPECGAKIEKQDNSKAETTKQEAPKICSSCGATLATGAKFCTKCSAKVEGNSNVAPTNAKVSAQQVTNGTISSAKKVPVGIVAACCGVGLVLIVAIICLSPLLSSKNKQTDENEQVASMESQTTAVVTTEATTEITTEVVTEATTEEPKEDFSAVAMTYSFCSGAGAWGTEIELKDDGSFSGSYHDSDMGSGGDGYEGTMYYSTFSGKFTSIKKISDYVYTATLDSVDVETPAGEEEIRDNTLYVSSEPYGYEDGKKFYFYLPGAKVSDLPEAFINWTSYGELEDKSTLDYPGMYNEKMQYGYKGY